MTNKEIDSKADKLLSVLGGWNAEELYCEMLYTLVHPHRYPNTQLETETLLEHLQQVFRTENSKHLELVDNAKELEVPPLVLNLEVVEAKDLEAKDVNGLSDPFCTVFISPKNKHNTSIKFETLFPVWSESFTLPVSCSHDDVLHVELWDYDDPSETLTNKVKQLGEVKSKKGLRILIKETAFAAATRQNCHDFLGCLKIPLKGIPTEGIDRWFPLESRNTSGKLKQGEVHLKLALGAGKDKLVAAQEYAHVLYTILMHELEQDNPASYKWEGNLSRNSALILRTLEMQRGLSKKDIDMAHWIVYTVVHNGEYQLNAKLFTPLCQALIETQENGLLVKNEVEKFWIVAERLIDNFVIFLERIRQSRMLYADVNQQLSYMLRTIGCLKTFLTDYPEYLVQFNSKLTASLITEKTENAIICGAHEFFTGIMQNNASLGNAQVENCVKVGQLLVADLKGCLNDKCFSCFKEYLDIEYFDILYHAYEEKFCKILKVTISDACNELKPLNFSTGSELQDKDISTGKSLFQLYLILKQFADLSTSLQNTKEYLYINGSFHKWFYAAVPHWFDIARGKAMDGIRKAVQLDMLTTVSDNEHAPFTSSSALDAANIFHRIEIWSQFSWPEIDDSYKFTEQIIEDICECTVFYADLIHTKVDEMEEVSEGHYGISQEICVAINNIDFVSMEMTQISDKLQVTKIIQKIPINIGTSVVSYFKRTLLEKAAEKINQKISEILECVCSKMRPSIQKLLVETNRNSGNNSGVEKLMEYLDNSLSNSRYKLNKPSTFHMVLSALWENVSIAVRHLITAGIQDRSPPNYFKKLDGMLQTLIDFFYPQDNQGENDALNNANIQDIKNMIAIYSASTEELIVKYYQTRYQDQVADKTGSLGFLTIRTDYCDDIKALRVEVLNARNLNAHDSNGQSDPYVKIQLVSNQNFMAAPVQRSKTVWKTLYPLFEETFLIPLSPEEFSGGGIIVFRIKDQDMIFKNNDFMGECFYPFESIPQATSNNKVEDYQQIILPLTLPKDWNSVYLQTLEHRHLCKTAADFIKKERLRVPAVSMLKRLSCCKKMLKLTITNNLHAFTNPLANSTLTNLFAGLKPGRI